MLTGVAISVMRYFGFSLGMTLAIMCWLTGAPCGEMAGLAAAKIGWIVPTVPQ